MNLFKRELKSGYKGILIWTISTMALNYVSYWKYGGDGAADQMSEIFTGFSNIVNTLLGVSPLGVSDVMGYSALIIYYVYFIGLIYALMLGSKILQKELDDHTSEFLFTKPISREHILATKSIVAVISMAIFNIFNALISVALMTSVNDPIYSNGEITKYITLAYVGLFILMLVTYFITIAANCVFANKRMSMIFGGLFIMYAYATGVAVLSFDKLTDWTIISPWRYFSLDVIVTDGFNFIYLIICIVIVVLAYLIARVGINKKMF